MQSSRQSESFVLVLGDDLLFGDLSPGVKSRARSTDSSKTIGDGAFECLQVGEGQEKTMDIGQVGDSLGGAGSADHTNHLLTDKLHGTDHENLSDYLVSRKARDSPNIHEVTIIGLANLIQALAESIRDTPNPDRDLESLREMRSQFLREFSRPGREDVDILGHPWFIDVRVHRVPPKSTASVRPRRNSSTAS